jgi:hypothetical protein
VSKNQMLRIINLALAALIITQVSSGFLMDEIGETAFDIVHVGGGLLLVACVLAHTWLNWGWVKSNYFRRQY